MEHRRRGEHESGDLGSQAGTRQLSAGKRTLTQRLSRPGPSADDIARSLIQMMRPAGAAEPAADLETTAPSVGSGEALPAELRGGMESSFGRDFSSVRVHHGSHVSDAGALAYTQGNELHFAPGQYDPGSLSGRELIGHELAHVVQQSDGRVSATKQAAGMLINDDEGLEHEADVQGARAARGESAGVSSSSGGGAIGDGAQRKTIQRWASLGTEFYRRTASAYDRADVSGVPGPTDGGILDGSGREAGAEQVGIFAGTGAGAVPGETEWRAELANGYGGSRLYGFLRAAMLDETQWRAHVLAHIGDIGVVSERTINDAWRTVRRPTDREQLALAKAMYMRSNGIAVDLGAGGVNELMTQFMARWQGEVVALMSDNDIAYGPEGAAPVAEAASHEQRVTMIGSGFGSIITGAMHYRIGEILSAGAGAEDGASARTRGLRDIRNGAYMVNAAQTAAEAIRTEERERYKTLIGIAMAGVPIPGLGAMLGHLVPVATLAANHALRTSIEGLIDKAADEVHDTVLNDHIIAALINPDLTAQIQRLRTEAEQQIMDWGMDDEGDPITSMNAGLGL